MNSVMITKTYNEPPFCEREILRYAGCKSPDSEILSLLHSCLNEVREKLSYQVCYRELSVRAEDSLCDFGFFRLKSKHLAQNLEGCSNVILFAATVGIQIDRLIAKYGRMSPSKALMMQAIGAERIEALCDAFCEELAAEKGVALRPRFSPGYGDLSLTAQKDIFAILECGKRIGLFLNDSLLMSPSKSVTAFVGIGGGTKEKTDQCNSCHQADCSYRGA